MTIGTRIMTWFSGRPAGQDPEGNRYFEERRMRPGALRRRRWVLYRSGEEATAVPPEWHAWLHYTTDAPIPLTARQPWQKPHLPNLTGTAEGYRPPGHDYAGGRAPTMGDYDPWTPGS